MNMLQGFFGQVLGVASGANQQNAATIGQFLRSLPDYNYEEGESLLTDLLMTMSEHLTFSDLVQDIMGNNVSPSMTRLRRPLRNFLLRRVLNLDENAPLPSPSELDSALLTFFDSIHPQFEDMANVVNTRDGVNVAETLANHFRTRMSHIAHNLVNENVLDETFSTRSVDLLRLFAGEFTALCRRVASDELSSLERLLENRLALISEGAGPTVRQWTLSMALGQLRTFAANNSVGEASVESFVVTNERGELLAQERAARRATVGAINTSQGEDEEQFATPRGSPIPMEVDRQQSQESSTSREAKGGERTKETSTRPETPESNRVILVVPPPVNANNQRFPRDLLPEAVGLNRGGSRGRPEPWHRAVSPEFIPVLESDTRSMENARESGQEQQRSFSDAYLSTQSAKRRKLASVEKPTGTAQEVVASCVRDAIEATGARPRGGRDARSVAAEVAATSGVVDAAAAEVGLQLGRRLAADPDFSAQRFPDAARSFVRK